MKKEFNSLPVPLCLQLYMVIHYHWTNNNIIMCCENRNRHTRNANSIDVDASGINKEQCRHAFQHCRAKYWNELPVHIRYNIQSFDQLKIIFSNRKLGYTSVGYFNFINYSKWLFVLTDMCILYIHFYVYVVYIFTCNLGP